MSDATDDDLAVGVLMAAGASMEQLRTLLDVASVDDVLPAVRHLQDTAAQLVADLTEASSQLAPARAARRTLFGLSARLMTQLAWCCGYLAGDEQELPADVKTTLDEAVALLPTIDEQIERDSV